MWLADVSKKCSAFIFDVKQAPAKKDNEILRNARNYSPSDAASLLRRLESAPASLTELKTSHNRKITVYVMIATITETLSNYQHLRQSVNPKAHYT